MLNCMPRVIIDKPYVEIKPSWLIFCPWCSSFIFSQAFERFFPFANLRIFFAEACLIVAKVKLPKKFYFFMHIAVKIVLLASFKHWSTTCSSFCVKHFLICHSERGKHANSICNYRHDSANFPESIYLWRNFPDNKWTVNFTTLEVLTFHQNFMWVNSK